MNTLPNAGDLFAEAIRESLKIEEPAEIVNAQLETARVLRQLGDDDYARAMMPGTLLRIRELDDPRERAFLMRLFIELQCEMGLLDDMTGTLRLLDFDAEQRQTALRTAGDFLAQAGRINEARQLAEEIEDLDDYESVLKAIGTRLADEKLFDEAYAVAGEIEPGLDLVILLRNIAIELHRAGMNPEAVKSAQESLAVARGLDEEPLRSEAISAAVDGFVSLHLVSEAMEAARDVNDLSWKTELHRRLAFFLWHGGNTAGGQSLIDEALETARRIGDPFHRIEALQHVGAVLHRMGNTEEATGVFREAQTAIKTVQNFYSRTRWLAEFADRIAGLGLGSAAGRMFRSAVEAAGNIEDPMLRVGMLENILARQAEAALVDEAMETLDLLEDCREEFDRRRLSPVMLDRTIAVSCAVVAGAMIRAETEGAVELFQRGLDLARRIPEPLERAAALRELAVGVAKTGRNQ